MKVLLPENFDPEIIVLTGAVVVWWGTIESLLIDEIMILNRLPLIAGEKECWPPQIATGRLISQWQRTRKIVAAVNPDPKTNLSALAQRTRRLATLRHRIVHSLWTSADETAAPGAVALSSYKPVKGFPGTVIGTEFVVEVATIKCLVEMLRLLCQELSASHERLQIYLRTIAKNSTFDTPEWPDVRILPSKPLLAE